LSPLDDEALGPIGGKDRTRLTTKAAVRLRTLSDASPPPPLPPSVLVAAPGGALEES